MKCTKGSVCALSSSTLTGSLIHPGRLLKKEKDDGREAIRESTLLVFQKCNIVKEYSLCEIAMKSSDEPNNAREIEHRYELDSWNSFYSLCTNLCMLEDVLKVIAPPKQFRLLQFIKNTGSNDREYYLVSDTLASWPKGIVDSTFVIDADIDLEHLDVALRPVFTLIQQDDPFEFNLFERQGIRSGLDVLRPRFYFDLCFLSFGIIFSEESNRMKFMESNIFRTAEARMKSFLCKEQGRV